MSLRELAESDSTDLLSIDGDEITLTSPTLEVYSVRGQYIRRGTDIDPGTGLSVLCNVSSFTVSISALVALGLPSVDSLQDDGWVAQSTDVTGAVVKARINKAPLDRTLGRVTMIGKV